MLHFPLVRLMSPRYHYSDLANGSVRLLRLLPHDAAAGENPRIECRFSQSPLLDSETAHPFEALSYAWGPEENPKSILVDGCEFPVRANLYSALSHLQDRFIERVLWVDALCINQKDTTEKGRQVQSMAKIYAKASRVIVWLGEATHNSGNAALEYIRSVSDVLAAEFDETMRGSIVNLLERSWFRRVWVRYTSPLQYPLAKTEHKFSQVIQEIAAARHIQVKCGSVDIEGFAFCSGLRALEQFWDTHPSLSVLIPPVCYLIRGAVFRPRYRHSPSDIFSLRVLHLGELVDMFHAREATDRRDKVYALLGMSLDDPSLAGLSADYLASWESLFRKLITFFLSDRVTVKTWGDKEVAVIRGKGRVLGEVLQVEKDKTWNNWQKITWVDMAYRSLSFAIQASAKSVRPGDIICHFEQAPNFTIVRLDKDYFAIIRIAIPLGEHSEATAFQDNFLLVWDWNARQVRLPAEDYEEFRIGQPLSTPEATCNHLLWSIRLWNTGQVLGRLGGREDDAKTRFELSFKIYAAFLASSGFDHANQGDWKDLLFADNSLSWQPLLYAAEKGYRDVVRQLLSWGADIERCDYGWTPLSCAAYSRCEAVVQELLSHSADIEAKDPSGRTALM